MNLAEIREFLLPAATEQDEGFRAEIGRLGRRALRIIGVVEITLPLLGVGVSVVLMGSEDLAMSILWHILASALLGICTYWCAGTYWGGQHSVGLAVLSGFFAVVIMTLNQVYLYSSGLTPRIMGINGIMIALLVGVAVLPALPWHIFALGSCSSLFYIGMMRLAVLNKWIPSGSVKKEEHAYLPVVIILCTILMAINHRRLKSVYLSHQAAMLAAENQRRAESRTLIAESAASMGRFAAAVSHELNSPLGAIRSAADSLRVIPPRLQNAKAGEHQRLSSLMDNLCSNVSSSASRMEKIVVLMQRFTNLDQAEIQSIDINQLLLDVAALVEAQSSLDVKIETDLRVRKPVPCRPQLLSVVFSGLLDKAIENAGNGGKVYLAAELSGASIQVSISDSGPELPRDKLVRLFDPEFHIAGGRVTTGNWSLFSARRLMMERGGDIRIENHPGKGTKFIVALPVLSEPT